MVRGKALWLRDFCPGSIRGFQFEMFFLVELGIVAGAFSREGGVGCLVARGEDNSVYLAGLYLKRRGDD